MTTSTGTILKNVARILGDETNEHWPAGVLIDLLNVAQNQVCIDVAHANVVTASTATVAGARQSIPTGGIRLLSIDGLREVSKAVLDRESPSWITTVSQSGTLTMWMKDPHTATEYLVYPPSDGASPQLLEYAAVPADISLGDDLTLADKFVPAVTDYMLYRAFSEDTDLKDPIRSEHFLGEYAKHASTA